MLAMSHCISASRQSLPNFGGAGKRRLKLGPVHRTTALTLLNGLCVQTIREHSDRTGVSSGSQSAFMTVL